jgi:hypothetical protein
MKMKLKLILLTFLVPSLAIAQVFLDRLDVDNIRLDANTISTTNTNGDLYFDLNGTGSLILSDLTATTVPYLDGNKKLTSSAATPTQLGYLANATSNLCGISQSCTLTNKTLTAPTITGGTLGIADGLLATPSLHFTDDANNGLYRISTDQWALVAGSYAGLQVRKSTGNYANLGMGGNASTSDAYPMLAEREYGSAIHFQLSNPSADAGAGAKWQLSSSAGNNGGEVGLFSPATVAPDAYSGGNMTIRSTGTTAGISYIADDSGAYHKFYVGGNGSGEKIATINSSGITAHVGAFIGPLTGAVTGNASTATALAANPSDCAADTYATTIAASGALTCAQVTNAGLAAAVSKAKGGTGADNSSVTFPSSGTIQAGTPSQYGVMISGSGSTYTVIAPDSSTTKVLTSGGSGAAPSWQSPAAGSTSLAVANKTANYTVTTSDDYITANTSGGAFTLTLPTAVGNTGKVFRFKLVTAGNILTIDGDGSETIDGLAAYKMGTQNDYLEIVSNGTNWKVNVFNIFAGARCYTGAGQSMAVGGSGEIIDFGTCVDPLGQVTTGASWKFTVLYPGRYSVKILTEWASNSWTSTGYVWNVLFKGGVLVSTLGFVRIMSTTSTGYMVNGSDTIQMSTTEYFDTRALHAEGSERALSAQTDRNYIVINREGN